MQSLQLHCWIWYLSQYIQQPIAYFTLKHTFNCKSTNIIYLITCKKCNKQYVGETGRSLSQRITDHISYGRLKKHTPTGLHFNLENHHISDFTIQPIEQICATNNNALMIRRNRELLWQRLLHTSHPIGFNNLNHTASMNTSNWKYLSTTIPIQHLRFLATRR